MSFCTIDQWLRLLRKGLTSLKWLKLLIMQDWCITMCRVTIISYLGLLQCIDTLLLELWGNLSTQIELPMSNQCWVKGNYKGSIISHRGCCHSSRDQWQLRLIRQWDLKLDQLRQLLHSDRRLSSRYREAITSLRITRMDSLKTHLLMWVAWEI